MLYLLDNSDPSAPFPDPSEAETEPNGLLAVGGDLTPERLLNAYRRGIFPWFSEDQPILWWSPDPRMILKPEELQVSRSLRKVLRKERFTLSMDQAFEEVIRACSGPRATQDGTWLLPEMIEAYLDLHQLGYAHSVETWHQGELVGGLYGISLGRLFFGESMFSKMPDASKAALCLLAHKSRQWHFDLIDCQVYTEHLERLGASEIPREEFQQIVDKGVEETAPNTDEWRLPAFSTRELIEVL